MSGLAARLAAKELLLVEVACLVAQQVFEQHWCEFRHHIRYKGAVTRLGDREDLGLLPRHCPGNAPRPRLSAHPDEGKKQRVAFQRHREVDRRAARHRTALREGLDSTYDVPCIHETTSPRASATRRTKSRSTSFDDFAPSMSSIARGRAMGPRKRATSSPRTLGLPQSSMFL